MVDNLGYVHMVYESPFCTSICFPDSLTYATNASGAWVTDVVDTDGFLVTAGAGIEQRNLRHPTLFIDDMNKPHLAYMSVYSNTIAVPEILEVTIKYAYKLGDIWRSYDVDYMPDLFKPVTSSDENGKAYISMHNDVNGNPALSYHDAANGGLKLATGTTVASPSLEAGVTPNNGDFGSINVGESSDRQFRLSNIGQLDLVISNISLSGVDTDQFVLDFNTGVQPCGNNNAILAPGDYCTFSMLFTPTRSGQANADVEIATNDPELGLIGASFTGVAATATSQGGGGGCSLVLAQNKEVHIPAYWIGLIFPVVIRVFRSTQKGARKPKKRYFVRYP